MVLAGLPLAGQTSSFEVVTLKLSPPPKENRIVINLGVLRGEHFTMGNVTLSDMMKFAYGLVSDDQLVVPDWNGQVRFDLEATTPAGTRTTDLRPMVGSLLAERLHLKLRREQRVMSYLALVRGKSAPKLRAADAGTNPTVGPQVRGKISHPKMPMQGLAALLSRFERQTVVDQTGLEGDYQVSLEWSPDNFSAVPDANAPPPDRPSLSTAVGAQLGLKLESRRGPLDVLVVESASRVPEEN
jgi:uncharacterized protein (TIGR03435 family)